MWDIVYLHGAIELRNKERRFYCYVSRMQWVSVGCRNKILQNQKDMGLSFNIDDFSFKDVEVEDGDCASIGQPTATFAGVEEEGFAGSTGEGAFFVDDFVGVAGDDDVSGFAFGSHVVGG